MNWYIKVLKKYAVFQGRAQRREYWMYMLVTIIIGWVINIIYHFVYHEPFLHHHLASVLYMWGTFLPGLAVTVRRLHDTNRNGWWLIVPIAGFVFMFFSGDAGRNRYGDDPKIIDQDINAPALD